MRCAVVGDHRRSPVEIAEVQPAAALLLDVEVIGLLADLGAHRLARRVGALDVGGNLAALLRHLLRHVEGEMRHWSVIGWRSAWYASSSGGSAPRSIRRSI